MWNRIAFCVAWMAAVVFACPCFVVSPCQRAGHAGVIFIGTVSEFREETHSARIQAERVFKGEVKGTVEVNAQLEVGRQFLIYASPSSTGGSPYALLKGCGTIMTLENASDDLAFLERFKAGKTTTIVSGIVRFQQDDRNAPEALDRMPMRGVHVTLTGEASKVSLTTNASGEFAFDELVPGSYTLRAEQDGSRLQWEPEPLLLSAGACHESELFMQTDRRVSGVVRDQGGTPVSGALVQMTAGDVRIAAVSDEQGRYEIPFVPPGEYYLGVNIKSTPTAESPFAPIYYPKGRRLDEAVRIYVPAGPSQQTYDMQTDSRLQLVKIRIEVVGLDDFAKEGPPVVLLRGVERGDLLSSAEADKDGVLVAELCAGITYEAFAVMGAVESARVEFLASEDRAAPVVLRMQRPELTTSLAPIR